MTLAAPGLASVGATGQGSGVPDRASRRALMLPGLALLLLVALVLSLGLGALAVDPWTLHEDDLARGVVLGLRLPRALLALVVGAGLAVSGAVMQGLFRNPLADPGLLGVSAGGALGAAIAVVLFGGVVAPPLAAFVAALIATIVVGRLGRGGPGLLLAGIAVTSLCSAFTGLLMHLADDAQLRSLEFWLLGSLSGAGWPLVVATAVPVGVALALAIPAARQLDALLLGEREAAYLGVDVPALRRRAMIVAALAVGAAVAAAGFIAFVGLVVPHLLRLVGGPGHRWLLPASALLGASLLLLADTAARTVVAPSELPAGVVTALVGAPFFLWLMRRQD